MRKHFLILMLLALLPLAGWAEDPAPAPVITATVQVGDEDVSTVTYSGSAYAPTVKVGGNALTSEQNATWEPAEIKNAGEYTVTVTQGDEVLGTATFTILPKEIVYFITGSTYSVGDKVDVANHYSIATGSFAGNEKLSDYAQFKFQTVGDNRLPLDENDCLTEKGTFTVSALRVVWNSDATPRNYDFRFTSSGNIVVAAKSISGFYVTPITEEFTYDGNAKELETVPLLFRTQEDAADPNKALEYGIDYTYTYKKNTNAGNAELVYEGLGNYGEELIAKFKIKKANIKREDFTEPTAVAKLSYTAEAKALIQGGTIVKGPDGKDKGTFKYRVGTGEWDTAIPQGTDAGDYVVSWKIDESDNYNAYSVTETVGQEEVVKTSWTIEDVKIARAKLVVQPKQALNVLYTGNEPDLTNVELAYQKFYSDDDLDDIFATDAAKPKVSVRQTIKNSGYPKGEYADGLEVTCGAVKDNSNYDVYPVDGQLNITPLKVKVKLVGGANRWNEHADFGTKASEKKNWDLKVVDKAKIQVIVQTGWDGETPVYTKANNEDNVVDAETVLKKKTVSNVDWFDGLKISRANESTEVGKYTLTLSGTLAKDDNYTIDAKDQTVATEDEEDPEDPEHDFAPYFYIDAQVVKVKAANKSKVYGGDDPKLTLTVTEGELNESQKAYLEKTLERAEGETVDVYDITFTKEAEGVTYKDGKPYINGLDITFNEGAFAITPKTLTITANPQTLYSGNAVSKLVQKEYKVDGLVNKTVNGVEINDQATVSLELDNTVVYSFTSFETGDEGHIYADGTVSVYGVDAVNGKTTLEVLSNNPTDPNAANFVGQKFVVNATPIAAGTTYPLYDLNGNATGISVKDIAQVSGVYVDDTTDPNTLNVPGEFNNAIKPVLATASVTALAANYDINYVYGKLTVIDSNALLVLDAKADNSDAIEAVNTAVNVTFKNRILKANTWYTMVVPFEVTTVELVNTLQALDAPTLADPEPTSYHSVYAIVDRMRKTDDADKINFTLEMLDIPANEPFLIKTAEDVDMSKVQFVQKEIVKAQPIINRDGNEFIGTYAPVTDLPARYNLPDKKYAFLGNADYQGSHGALQNTWYKTTLEGLVINSTEAYLHYAYNTTNEAPVITIEDFDFETGTTSIKTLNAETMKAYSVDGWYTLNGIKLQSMPTEKGVYINNGKKVVIK